MAYDIAARRKVLGLVRGDDGRLTRQPASASDPMAAIGAMLARIGAEMQAMQPAPAPAVAFPPIEPSAPEPVAVAAPAVVPVEKPVMKAEGKAWTLETRDIHTGAMKRVHIKPQGDGYVLTTQDRYGNPRVVTMRST